MNTNYVSQDPGKFSLIDLCLIRLGAYGKSLRHQIKIGMDHVFGKDGNSATSTDNGDNCPLCFARGFICEECRSEDVIFPFQPESEVNIYIIIKFRLDPWYSVPY